jgi:hypothetical protein
MAALLREIKKSPWDHLTVVPPLEKLLLRTFYYGSFEKIRKIYRQNPDESYDIMLRYPELKHGVKYWINEWHSGDH